MISWKVYKLAIRPRNTQHTVTAGYAHLKNSKISFSCDLGFIIGTCQQLSGCPSCIVQYRHRRYTVPQGGTAIHNSRYARALIVNLVGSIFGLYRLRQGEPRHATGSCTFTATSASAKDKDAGFICVVDGRAGGLHSLPKSPPARNTSDAHRALHGETAAAT